MIKPVTIFIISICIALISCSTTSNIKFSKGSSPIFLDENYYTGFLPIPQKGSMFFWLFEARNKPSEVPLVIWLSESPGCSSVISIFYGNGPYRINPDDNTLRSSPLSWNKIANVLYVDLSLGTGYSTGNYINKNGEEMSSDFYIFLEEFLGAFPEYKGRDFYLTGAAYAGHYIPAIALKIQKKGGINMNFKGVTIGNGVFSGYHQYQKIAGFAYSNRVIDWATYSSVFRGLNVCANLIRERMTSIAEIQCKTQLNKMTGAPPRFNIYSFREPCVNPPFCYDFTSIENFLKQKSVQDALGIYNPWVSCNKTVLDELSLDITADSIDQLSEVVQSGIQVLIYYGDEDVMYNWKGGEVAVHNLVWSGAKYFVQIPLAQYGNFGEYKFLGNLIFYRIYKSGQMVGRDNPMTHYDMLEKFIQGWS